MWNISLSIKYGMQQDGVYDTWEKLALISLAKMLICSKICIEIVPFSCVNHWKHLENFHPTKSRTPSNEYKVMTLSN